MNGCSAFEVATFNSDTAMIQLIASTSMGKGKKITQSNCVAEFVCSE